MTPIKKTVVASIILWLSSALARLNPAVFVMNVEENRFLQGATTLGEDQARLLEKGNNQTLQPYVNTIASLSKDFLELSKKKFFPLLKEKINMITFDDQSWGPFSVTGIYTAFSLDEKDVQFSFNPQQNNIHLRIQNLNGKGGCEAKGEIGLCPFCFSVTQGVTIDVSGVTIEAEIGITLEDNKIKFRIEDAQIYDLNVDIDLGTVADVLFEGLLDVFGLSSLLDEAIKKILNEVIDSFVVDQSLYSLQTQYEFEIFADYKLNMTLLEAPIITNDSLQLRFYTELIDPVGIIVSQESALALPSEEGKTVFGGLQIEIGYGLISAFAISFAKNELTKRNLTTLDLKKDIPGLESLFHNRTLRFDLVSILTQALKFNPANSTFNSSGSVNGSVSLINPNNATDIINIYALLNDFQLSLTFVNQTVKVQSIQVGFINLTQDIGLDPNATKDFVNKQFSDQLTELNDQLVKFQMHLPTQFMELAVKNVTLMFTDRSILMAGTIEEKPIDANSTIYASTTGSA